MNIGKKILSAFVEVTEQDKPAASLEKEAPVLAVNDSPPVDTGKFKQHFDKLFAESNLPGPDYFEFSRMTEAMNAITDEKARYAAAFAGLNVQGLDKHRLLSTAAQYLDLLDKDESGFDTTIDATLQEKVHSRKKEMEERKNRIQQLSQEIADLHHKIAVLQNEISENEEKIRSSTGGYKTALKQMKSRILLDIEKIKQYIN